MSNTCVDAVEPVSPPQGVPVRQAAERSRVGRSLRWDYVVFFVTLHLLTLLVFVPYFFTWIGVAAFFAGMIVFGQLAIPIGYHRLLAHKSFRCPKWFERTLVTLAMCAAQETPAQWVAWHRRHHVHSDEPEDPHTPRVTFFWAHVSWLVHESRSRLQTFSMFEKYARDILADPYYRWLEKLPSPAGLFFLGHAVVCGVITATLAVLWYGWGPEALRVTASVMLWGIVARTVWVWHITWSVNSLTHLFGYRNYETGDDSRNNWFVSLLTAGEGWHNNHHADPASASVQHRWWELDPNYYTIRLFEAVGLASDVVPPRHRRRRTAADSPK
jgi:fatty-acid desaturase